jgi:uncharacterized protein (TIGR03437 family)
VTSSNGGTGNTATASLTVALPAMITKTFGALTLPVNGTTSLSFAITNPNPTFSLTGLAFTDNLPSGLVVATPANLSNNCGGTATAAAGAASATLVGGTLGPNASCTVSLNVQGTSSGIKNNSVTVSSTQSGLGNTSNASVTVIAPPVTLETFGVASIPLGASTTLSFSIQNNNATAPLTGVGVTDTLPAGLIVSTPNSLTGSCGSGTITATAGTNVINLTGGSIPSGAMCGFSVSVTGTAAGAHNNSTGSVISNEGGTGGPATASLEVVAPPSIAIAFGGAAIAVSGTTTLVFTITNPAANGLSLAGVAFTDTLPAGIALAMPNGLSNTCGGTVTPGPASISLSGGIVNIAGSCTISINVVGSVAGNYNTAAAVSSINGGTGNTASAGLTVQPADLTIAKSHTGNFMHGQTGATYTLTVSNAGQGPTVGAVSVVEALPTGLTATAIAGPGWACNLSTLTCTRSDVLPPGASFPAITVTVNVSNTAPASVVNIATVSGGGETNTTNDSASDLTTIAPAAPASITAISGTPQTIIDSASFAPLVAVVRDAGSLGTPGITVTFTANGGGTFSNGLLVATAITDNQGMATAPPFTATGVGGTFTVLATVSGISAPATFSLTVINTNLRVVPSSLSFTYNLGDSSAPPAQTVGVAADTAIVVTASVTPGTPWLSAAIGSSSATSAAVAVGVNPAGLAAGVYTGSVVLTVGSGKIPVPVTLTVVGFPTLVLSPRSLSFTAQLSASGDTPPPQTVLLGAQNRNVSFTLAASAPWIVVSSGRSSTPATLNVSVNAAGLSAGSYTGNITITAPGATNSPFNLPVTLIVTSGPVISPGGIQNAASLATGPGAPNAILVLYGNFNCTNAPRVLVSDQPVEVIGFTSGVITFALPASVDGAGSVPVKVDCGGQTSAPIDVPIVAASPGIFTLSMMGTGQGAVLNADLSVNGAGNPTARNSTIAVYATGFGTYRDASADGLQRTTLDVQAFVGDIPARVDFAGHAPDLSLGVQQINIVIPSDAPIGPAVPIRLVVNGISTQAGVIVAIQ